MTKIGDMELAEMLGRRLDTVVNKPTSSPAFRKERKEDGEHEARVVSHGIELDRSSIGTCSDLFHALVAKGTACRLLKRVSKDEYTLLNENIR